MASEKILKMKEEEVKKLAEKMKNASLVLLTDYRGINVEDVTGLRAELRKTNAEKDKKLEEKDKEIERLKKLLAKK